MAHPLALRGNGCADTAARTAAVPREAPRLASSPLALRGRLRISKEGISGTLAGRSEATEEWMTSMQQHPHLQGMDCKPSDCEGELFPDLSIRVVQELVSTGAKVASVDPATCGIHLSPQVRELLPGSLC